MSKDVESNKMKVEIKKINTERDEIITKAYVTFRVAQKKAKQDAKAKILDLETTLKKSIKK